VSATRTLGVVLCGWLLAAGSHALAAAAVEEFVGPFPSWADVKTEYGAIGDGKADDTAAIQKALIELRGKDSPKRVLYFPAGTYRITATLKLDRISHHEPLGMSIAGEDPEKTVIRWDGPAGENMLRYNAWYASLSRLTFDGAGKAKTAIEHGESFTTANEFADVVVKDVQFGIEAGIKDGIAETAVLRCRFYRCAKAAISIQNFNSLDWYIWNCWFEDCGIGVTNEFGAGNFHVYRSVFRRSTEADITIRHTGYFSFVGNKSIESKAFFHAKRAKNWKDTETWGSQATLQDNRIFFPRDSAAIWIENNGPNLLVDNLVRTAKTGPSLLNEPPAETADLISVGNKWTGEAPLKVKGRLTTLDDSQLVPGETKQVKPVPAPFAARVDRPIIEVKAGADAAAIQAAIDEAAAMKGKRPVVHLPKGNYRIAKTLVIPTGCDLQLVGDGPENATQLSNAGGASPLIRVNGPTYATFRNFLVNAGNDAVGILVENCDQPGSRIFGEQLNTTGYEYGFVADGLKNAYVELRDQGHDGMQVIGPGPEAGGARGEGKEGTRGEGRGTRENQDPTALGSPRSGLAPSSAGLAPPASPLRPWVALFCGASSRDTGQKAGIHLYDVQNGARLFVRDIWYEGGAWSLMNLTGSGEFAYHCGFVAPYAGFDENIAKRLGAWEADVRKSVAPLQFDGFRGKLAFTLVSTNGAAIRVVPPSPDLKLYLLGYVTNQKIELGGPEVKGQVVAEHVRVFRKEPTGLDAVEGTGKSTPEFIREMLKPLREVKPQPLAAPKDGATDVRFYRVWANGRNGVRVQAAAAP